MPGKAAPGILFLTMGEGCCRVGVSKKEENRYVDKS